MAEGSVKKYSCLFKTHITHPKSLLVKKQEVRTLFEVKMFSIFKIAEA